MDAAPNTPAGDELDLLSLLVHDYEEKTFPIDNPDPVAAIRFPMEQQGPTWRQQSFLLFGLENHYENAFKGVFYYRPEVVPEENIKRTRPFGLAGIS